VGDSVPLSPETTAAVWQDGAVTPRAIVVVLLTLSLVACGTPPTPTAGPSTTRPSPAGTAGSPGPIAISENSIGSRLDALAALSMKEAGWRSTGSKGYDAAADYVATELRAAGWHVTDDRFSMPGFFDDGGSKIRTNESTFTDGDVRPLIYAPAGDVSGPVVSIGWDAAPGTNTKGCQAPDNGRLPRNAIVLVAPGPCIRRTAIQAAQAAGAKAFVAGYTSATAGMALRATLLTPDGLEIPAVGASKPVGDALAAVASRGGTARVLSTADTRMIDTHSVIGQLDGTDPGKVVMAGAHLDSVLDGPGINDNGSGVAALLEIARALGNDRPKATIRLGFWAGEELGLLGSTHYVGALSDAERAALIAYVNADMVASPNGFTAIDDDSGDKGDGAALADLLQAEVERAGGSPVAAAGGGSDHVPFEQAGITVGGLDSGATEILTPEQARVSGSQAGLPADACYHQVCDDRSNVRLDLARILTTALGATVRTVAGAGAIPGAP
jgi:Zn-dependent M28 family amino/carboxypeptidase